MPRMRGSVRQSPARRSAARPAAPEASPFFASLLKYGVVAASLALTAGLGVWLWNIGWPQKQGERLAAVWYGATKRAGLEVHDVLVEGRNGTEKIQLLNALAIERGAPTLAFDPAEAYDRVKQLPWVAEAVVERRLPGTVYLAITERKPLARWQNGGVTRIIDTTGMVLPQADPTKFLHLPLVVGQGADEEAGKLVDMLKTRPDIAKILRAAVRVGARRWDLQVEPNVTIRLPEQKIDQALDRLVQMMKEQHILARNVIGIDLRVPDRLVFETPTPVPATKQAGEPKI